MFLSIYYLLALVLILTVHEAAHAYTALRLGDPTAQRAGRVSLNPLRHLDPLGTIMLFVAGIGWGKPVPIDARNFKKPIWDQAMTALAGPVANLILAILAAIPFSYLPDAGYAGVKLFCQAVMDLSILLFLFNMLPFPPLDGSKFVVILVPKKYQMRFLQALQKSMPYFIALVVIDLYFMGRVLGFSLVWTIIEQATYWVRTAILTLV